MLKHARPCQCSLLVVGQISKCDINKQIEIWGSCKYSKDLQYIKDNNKYDHLAPIDGETDPVEYTKKIVAITNSKPIDLYIDNTGGMISCAVLNLMNPNGLVVVLGQNSAESWHFQYGDAVKSAGCEAIGLNLTHFEKEIKSEFTPFMEPYENKEVKLALTTVEGFSVVPDIFVKLRDSVLRGAYECNVYKQKGH